MYLVGFIAYMETTVHTVCLNEETDQPTSAGESHDSAFLLEPQCWNWHLGNICSCYIDRITNTALLWYYNTIYRSWAK